MSSISRQTRPRTWPMTAWTTTWFARFGSRLLWMTARGASSRSVHWSATRTLPASGETTVMLEVSYIFST